MASLSDALALVTDLRVALVELAALEQAVGALELPATDEHYARVQRRCDDLRRLMLELSNASATLQ